jgi:hypothetical protein
MIENKKSSHRELLVVLVVKTETTTNHSREAESGDDAEKH